MMAWLQQNGSPLFLGMPLFAYMCQALLVYRPGGRYGLMGMMICYSGALVCQYLDSRGI